MLDVYKVGMERDKVGARQRILQVQLAEGDRVETVGSVSQVEQTGMYWGFNSG